MLQYITNICAVFLQIGTAWACVKTNPCSHLCSCQVLSIAWPCRRIPLLSIGHVHTYGVHLIDLKKGAGASFDVAPETLVGAHEKWQKKKKMQTRTCRGVEIISTGIRKQWELGCKLLSWHRDFFSVFLKFTLMSQRQSVNLRMVISLANLIHSLADGTWGGLFFLQS